MLFPDVKSIKNIRISLQLTQKDLSLATNISQSMIAKLESGRIVPSYDIAKKLFSYLESISHKSEKKCSDLMSKGIIYLKEKDKVIKASEIMKKNSISQIPIINNEKIVGSITESLLYEQLEKGISKENLFNKTIGEIMQEPFPILSKETPISIAMHLLKNSSAIILLDKNKISGILTKSDLL